MRTYSHSDNVLRLLRGGREVGYADLMRQLRLSQKQCRRIMNGLEQDGVVARRADGRETRFTLVPGSEPVRGAAAALTEDDVFALLAAAQAGQSLFAGTPLAGDLAAAARKLESTCADRLVAFEPEMVAARMQFGATVEADIDAATFRSVRQALLEGRAMRIAYANLEGKRSYNRAIDPYLLAYRNGSWLLVAFCRFSGKVLNFSLAGIERAELTDEYVERIASFDAETWFRDSFGVFGGEVHTVRLRAEAAKAPAFRRKRYHPTQQIEEEREDGSVIVSYEVAGLPEVLTFIRSWGPGVEVLEPAEVRAVIEEEARRVFEAYGGASIGRIAHGAAMSETRDGGDGEK